MSRNALKYLLLLTLVAGFQAISPARAQDEKAAAEPADSSTADLRLEDPAVRYVLEDNPQTPAELVRAISILVDLDRAALARPLLARLLGMKLDARKLADLQGKFDSALFIKLARVDALAPQGAQLADAVFAAAALVRDDPAHLDGLIKQLADPKEEVRRGAANQLRGAHEAAVGPLLRALADPQRARLHPAVMAQFTQLGDEAAGPLEAALVTPNEAIAVAATRALGQLQSSSATAELLAVAFTGDPKSPLAVAASETLARILGHSATTDEAREFFRSDIRRLLDHARKHRDEGEASVGTWRWDEKTSGSVRVNLPPAELAAETAARYGRALETITEDIDDERLALLAQLTAAKYAAPDRPLATGPGTLRDAVGQKGVQVVEGVLIDALATGQMRAATAAVEILGDIGTEKLLDTAGAALSPLAQAARSGDRRLRFAAVDAILRIHPTQAFAGDALIVDGLRFFAATSGTRRALVGHPRRARTEELASLLAGLGYQADVATNSRQLLDLAARCPDYELALIDVSLGGPPADDFIGRLRRDPRTADLPVGLMVGEDLRKNALRLAAAWPRVVALARVADEESLQFEVGRLLASAGRNRVDFEERQVEAANSLAWLAKLADAPISLFKLAHVEPAVERALHVPALATAAATILADLPDVASQHALLEMACDSPLPLETRQTAAVAFARNVRQFGVHLTSAEILAQYDRYNAGRLQDEGTAKILASILDAIEDRAAARAEPSEPGR